MKKSSNSLISHIPDYLEYLEIEKGLAQLSVRNYDRFLQKFKKWLNSGHKAIKPHELSPEIVSKYRLFLAHSPANAKTGENLKKSTQNYYLIALRSFLSYLLEKDIECLPPDKIKLAKQQDKERIVKFLTLEQLERVLLSPNTKSESGIRDRAILETLFSTGLRVSELASLDRDQLPLKSIKNADSFEITIRGKGGHPRTVYFSKRTIEWLVKYLEKRTDTEPALFINYRVVKTEDSDRRLSTRSMQNILKKYSKAAGLAFVATPHTLRHTYATDLLNHGVDLRTVQEFLGHKNISTTQIYTHVTNKRLKDIHKKFHSGENLKS